MILLMTHLTIPILTALFSAGLAIVFERYVRVIGLQAQIPEAPECISNDWKVH